MKRTLLYIVCCMLSLSLTGCFGIGDNSRNSGGKGSISFEIEGSVWHLTLPTDWEEIEADNYPDQTVLVAQNLTQNFIIEQYPDFTPGIGAALWEKQSLIFYHFKGITQGEDAWEFEAQSTADKPLRHYYQKVFPITGTTNYLLGSCSREVAGTVDDCPAIMGSWSVKIPKK